MTTLTKIEAVANALMAKNIEIDTGLRRFNAKVYASAAIDAINEWDREHPNRVYTTGTEINERMKKGINDIFGKSNSTMQMTDRQAAAYDNEMVQGDIEEPVKGLVSEDWLKRIAQLEHANSMLNIKIHNLFSNHGNRLGKLEIAPWSEKEFNKRLDKLEESNSRLQNWRERITKLITSW